MPVMENREYRNINIQDIEVRDQGEEMTVEGYAATFDQEYELFRAGKYIVMESVDGHAFDETDMRDVIMQYDHEGRVFARSGNGTLEVKPDAHGLRVRASLGGTEIGRQLYEEIRGGYTTKMSFGFTVTGQERSEEERDGATILHRKITKVGKLYDVSAVSLPANDATEISSRTCGNGLIAEVEQERLAIEARKNHIRKIRLLIEIGGDNNDGRD